MIVRNWMARKLSYARDFENFESWIARQMSYTDDFETYRNRTHRNLCHKQSILFYGHPFILYSRYKPYNILCDSCNMTHILYESGDLRTPK